MGVHGQGVVDGGGLVGEVAQAPGQLAYGGGLAGPRRPDQREGAALGVGDGAGVEVDALTGGGLERGHGDAGGDGVVVDDVVGPVAGEVGEVDDRDGRGVGERAAPLPAQPVDGVAGDGDPDRHPEGRHHHGRRTCLCAHGAHSRVGAVGWMRDHRMLVVASVGVRRRARGAGGGAVGRGPQRPDRAVLHVLPLRLADRAAVGGPGALRRAAQRACSSCRWARCWSRSCGGRGGPRCWWRGCARPPSRSRRRSGCSSGSAASTTSSPTPSVRRSVPLALTLRRRRRSRRAGRPASPRPR